LNATRIGYDSPYAKDDVPHNTLSRGWRIFGYGLIDASSVRADVMRINPQDWSEAIPQNGGRIDRGFQEDISSAYVMANSMLFQRRLTLLGGVRIEQTDVSAYDNLRADPTTGADSTRGDDSYTDAFPSLHATWKANSLLQFRASYSTSIGRPSPGSIIPGITVTEYEGENLEIPGRINKVNVGLKPRYVDNFELAAEYYPKQGGRFSVGLFRKNMSSFIYNIDEIIGAGPENGFDGDYEGWELRTQANGGSGRLEGWEVDYQSPQLGKYASILNGFSFFANYTKLKATGDYGDGGNGVLAGFKPETGNLGLAFRRNGTSIRLRGNYVSTYLRFPNGNPALERWEWRKFKVDLNIERKLTKNMSAYIDIINLNNSKGRRFRGNPEDGFRLNWVDDNGPELYAGINLLY
jgi:TonB-dependent receptor